MLYSAVLYHRISVVDDDEFAPRHANADVERARLAVAPGGGENSHAFSVAAVASEAENGTPRHSDTVIGGVVVDEDKLQVGIAALQCLANALPNGGSLVSPGCNHRHQRFRL